MDAKMLARLGAVVFVAVAITATAIEMNRTEEVREAWPSGRTTQAQGDPLRDELIRCQVLGEAGPRERGPGARQPRSICIGSAKKRKPPSLVLATCPKPGHGKW